MTRSARAVWERDIDLYSKVWLVIFQYSWSQKGVMIHGDRGKEENGGEKLTPLAGHSLVDQSIINIDIMLWHACREY
jgi:hypothetical protein